MDPKSVIELCFASTTLKSSTFASPTYRASGITSAIPSANSKKDSFKDGFGFDGSSIRGWAVDPRIRHAAHARPDYRVHGPVPRYARRWS